VAVEELTPQLSEELWSDTPPASYVSADGNYVGKERDRDHLGEL
jgi:hypothetical protein